MALDPDILKRVRDYAEDRADALGDEDLKALLAAYDAVVAREAIERGISDGKQLVIAQLEARLSEAVKVLGPFAKADETWIGMPTEVILKTITGHRLTREHLRAARDFIASLKAEGQGASRGSGDVVAAARDHSLAPSDDPVVLRAEIERLRECLNSTSARNRTLARKLRGRNSSGQTTASGSASGGSLSRSFGTTETGTSRSAGSPDPSDECSCRACTQAFCAVNPPEPGAMILGVVDPRLNRMFLCETCGNKRCPHATDHRHACTGSNEPGQPGSAYK